MSESEEDIADKNVKVAVLGDSNVGKTSLVRRFCYDEFTRYYVQTMGADFYIKRMDLSKKKDISVRISDIGGMQLNENMLKNYLFNTDIIILVYDITSSESFNGMMLWLNEVKKILDSPKQIAIFGNKIDLEHKRSVRVDKTREFGMESQFQNFLVSAKSGENRVLKSKVDNAINISKLSIKLPVQCSDVPSLLPFKRIEGLAVTRNLKIHVFKRFSLLFKIIIEKYTENVRFCIICNYLSKIIPALQSRCTRFRFGPLSPDQILPRLNYVVDEEKVTITEDGKKALLTLANGDMRKVLNVLQSTWLAYKNVTEDNVYTCVGHPLRTDIENIVKWLLNEDFQTTYKNIKELKMIKGLALHDILTEVHKYVHRIEFPFNVLIDLLENMSEIENRLCAGASENIQLTALISAFQNVKDITPPESS